MKINPKLIQTIEAAELPVEEALLFCAAVELNKYGTLDFLILNSGIVSPENEHKFRINLCQHDVESDNLVLKVPLFVANDMGVTFTEFTKRLAERGITYKGHVNNPMTYSIVGGDDEKEFDALLTKLETPNINKLIDVVVNYYASTAYASKLSKFFKETAYMMYMTYQPPKSDMI